MALVIRLRQQGKTNRICYRLVVTDEKSPRDGKYIEMLGWYNPFAEGERNMKIATDKVQFWLDKGAQISERAKALLKRAAPEVAIAYNQKKHVKKVKEAAQRKKK